MVSPRGDVLADRLAAVEEAIERACTAAQRPRESVTLVAISKFHPPSAIREAYELGVRNFGENYAQDLVRKRAELEASCPELRWHFTGRVQRNKAKLLQNVHLVHGIGSREQLEAVAHRAGPTDVLLQVNAAGEQQKNGFDPDELRRDLGALLEIEGARVRGLMNLPPQDEDEAAVARRFAEVRALRDDLEERFGVKLPELSMGMSGDFPLAIREGATLIRIGTALFGPRPG